jgi:hypothetical protein
MYFSTSTILRPFFEPNLGCCLFPAIAGERVEGGKRQEDMYSGPRTEGVVGGGGGLILIHITPLPAIINTWRYTYKNRPNEK